MKLPACTLPALLRLHAWGMRRPYFDLPGYMLRGWVLGFHSATRNHDSPAWLGWSGGRLHTWLTDRIAIRAHTILRSDRDRARHDHPVDSISVVLAEGYWEVCEPTAAAVRWPTIYATLLDYSRFAAPETDGALLEAFGIHWRGPGCVVFRRAEAAHRIVIPVGGAPAKTLWIIGRKRRSWGFHAPGGWVHWREYLGIDA